MLAFFADGAHSGTMPQIQLTVFPASSTAITTELPFEQRDGQVYYFNGHLPVFTHTVDDIASFRFFTSRLIANGSASRSLKLKHECKPVAVRGCN